MYTAKKHALLFVQKSLVLDGWMDGWMDVWVRGWMDGRKGQFFDCLQQ